MAEDAGTEIVKTGTSVPTVGAVALLYIFKYLTAALVLVTATAYTVPADAFTATALVLAAEFKV